MSGEVSSSATQPSLFLPHLDSLGYMQYTFSIALKIFTIGPPIIHAINLSKD